MLLLFLISLILYPTTIRNQERLRSYKVKLYHDFRNKGANQFGTVLISNNNADAEKLRVDKFVGAVMPAI
jgi:DUF4097 and DUF4098 domain-containing protein YvlB